MTAGRAEWTADGVAAYCACRRPSEVDELVLRRLAGAGRVLEVGCGPGMLQAGSGAGLLVETDTSRLFLARARERSAGRSVFCASDASALPFRSGSFDALAAMAVLHCFDDDVLSEVMGEARRVLAPGGRLVLAEDWAFTDPSPCEAVAEAVRFADPADREHHRDSDAWREILRGSGFSVSFSGWAPRPFDPMGTPAGREGRLDPGMLSRLPAGPFVRMLVLEGTKR